MATIKFIVNHTVITTLLADTVLDLQWELLPEQFRRWRRYELDHLLYAVEEALDYQLVKGYTWQYGARVWEDGRFDLSELLDDGTLIEMEGRCDLVKRWWADEMEDRSLIDPMLDLDNECDPCLYN